MNFGLLTGEVWGVTLIKVREQMRINLSEFLENGQEKSDRDKLAMMVSPHDLTAKEGIF
jgi:hypothetical protein